MRIAATRPTGPRLASPQVDKEPTAQLPAPRRTSCWPAWPRWSSARPSRSCWAALGQPTSSRRCSGRSTPPGSPPTPGWPGGC